MLGLCILGVGALYFVGVAKSSIAKDSIVAFDISTILCLYLSTVTKSSTVTPLSVLSVITSTTENQYTNDEFANTKHYTGTFATAEGYLYFVDLEIVTSAEDEVQTATAKAKRIM